ncbi:MAG: lipoate--protein ligase family protein [Thermoplasmata archaeon]|nr:MAG: lipoate--protein ligase family protein [Thermoplasmata archaeon]
MEQELDLDYCKKHKIGYFRRETGGGTVFLDKYQIFYQVIIRRDNPLTPRNNQAFFEKFLKPVVRVLSGFGLQGNFVPINDIIVGQKKISGNGGGEIGDCKVLVGNLLLDFNFTKIANILNVPNKEFRNRVLESMRKNMTTIKNELGLIPSQREIKDALISEYEKSLGPLTPAKITDDIWSAMDELDRKFSTKKWLFQKVPKRSGRDIKIREGIMIIYRSFESHNRRYDIIFELEDEKIRDIDVVSTSGTTLPNKALMNSLIGIVFEEKEVLNIINELHRKQDK